ncbi:hypothetical protein ACCO45_010974 [Purpureocillium lilacinum]|uniref:Uncharacterized protein n=1 Tax=Purpureocillium lilacinum TaxID=33203 RepID=A0ACC4DGA9_PURLI
MKKQCAYEEVVWHRRDDLYKECCTIARAGVSLVVPFKRDAQFQCTTVLQYPSGTKHHRGTGKAVAPQTQPAARQQSPPASAEAAPWATSATAVPPARQRPHRQMASHWARVDQGAFSIGADTAKETA